MGKRKAEKMVLRNSRCDYLDFGRSAGCENYFVIHKIDISVWRGVEATLPQNPEFFKNTILPWHVV